MLLFCRGQQIDCLLEAIERNLVSVEASDRILLRLTVDLGEVA
jgi:hypothetical protein